VASTKHVYVPLLLRPSNVVEENPGPKNIDHTHTVHAGFNQSNESMFPMLENKVLPCHYALLFAMKLNLNIWDPSILNQILGDGNNLYSVIWDLVLKEIRCASLSNLKNQFKNQFFKHTN
jgi:hypothetical protein